MGRESMARDRERACMACHVAPVKRIKCLMQGWFLNEVFMLNLLLWPRQAKTHTIRFADDQTKP